MARSTVPRFGLAMTLAFVAALLPTPAAPQAVAQAGLSLSATFSVITARIPCTAHDGTLEYKRTADSAWLPALPVWNSGGTCAGSVLGLDPATLYDVRVTVDGATTTASIATRTDAIPSTEALVPTHHVRLTGSDTTGDGSSGNPWRTVKKAVQVAPSGAVVQVGSGASDEYFVGQEASTAAPTRTTPITFVAAYPALAPNGAVANAGHRTIIEGSVRAAPSTITDPEMPSGPWVQVPIVGTDGVTRQVWKWPGAVPAGTTLHTLAWTPTAGRATLPTRMARWAPDAADLATVEGWSALAWTNLTYRYGFYQSGQDLYVRVQNDANPNTRWWVGGTTGLALGGPDSRVSGFVLRGFHMAVLTGPGSDRFILDRNEIQTSTHGLRTSGVTDTSPYPEDMVAQFNYARNTSIASLDQANAPSIPWDFVKRTIKRADGTTYPTVRIGGTMEGSAIIPVGSHRTVVRNNTLQGYFDGVGTVNVANAPLANERVNADWEIYGNTIRQMADEGVEPARGGGWVVRDNRVEHTKTLISTGSPTLGAPIFIVRNTVWRTGGYQLARDTQGNDAGSRDGMYIKYDAESTNTTQTRVYLIHNTLWSDWGGFVFPNGIAAKLYESDDAAGSGSFPAGLYARNNIVRTTDYAFGHYANPNGEVDEDYNQLTTSHATRFVAITAPSAFYNDLASYRAGTGMGAHSNLGIADPHDEAALDSQFVNATGGDLTLTATSVLRGIGQPIPNVSDGLGRAPNLGAAP